MDLQPRPETSVVTELLVRLEEAYETLRAIRDGEVDALVVWGTQPHERVYTLETADRTYRMFVERMQEGAATLSLDGIVLFANRRLSEILRLPVERLMGTSIDEFLDDDDRTLQQLLAYEGEPAHAELRFHTADGRDVETLVAAVRLEAEEIVCLTVTELTDQKEHEREIRRLHDALALQVTKLDQRNQALEEMQTELNHRALHDALTGLPNRALLMDRIDQALAQASRTDLLTALLFLDLDRFKQLNDGLGHDAGDAVLRETAGRLLGAVRPSDTVCRFGGDEFIVLATMLADEEQLAAFAARLLDALVCPHSAVEGAPVLTASVGISMVRGGRGLPEQMLREADTAMYEAKAQGGNRSHTFDVMLGQRVVDRLSAEHELRRALEDGRVVAHFQPIIDLRSGAVSAVEALARLRLADGGLVLPASFLAAAEASGLVLPLGEHILTAACDRLAVWRRRAPEASALRISVNVSPRQLARDHVLEVARRLLGSGSLPGETLQLEITESALVDPNPATLRTLHGLRELGVQIGLDDFGTGYASLTQLRLLPIDFVKVDKSFVRALTVDRDAETIAGAVVDLARRLDLRSIAEGVETAEQRDRLAVLGCDEMQGYLFSAAVPDHEVPSMLERFGKQRTARPASA